MVKAKDPATVAEVVKAARKKTAKETKGMNIDEIQEYHRKREEAGMKRFEAAKAAYDALPESERKQRDVQVMLRLTQTEKAILERDAASENAKSVSALVRSRSLLKQSPFETILARLDVMMQDINQIKKKLQI